MIVVEYMENGSLDSFLRVSGHRNIDGICVYIFISKQLRHIYLN